MVTFSRNPTDHIMGSDVLDTVPTRDDYWELVRVHEASEMVWICGTFQMDNKSKQPMEYPHCMLVNFLND